MKILPSLIQDREAHPLWMQFFLPAPGSDTWEKLAIYLGRSLRHMDAQPVYMKVLV